MARIAVAGATGLVGSACIRQLLAEPSFERVIALTRRPLPPVLRALPGSSRLEERIVDFEDLERSGAALEIDQVLCALGSTMKQAGSKERFRQIDFGYPLALARVGLAAGARHFLLVSSIGAFSRSRAFYTRVKGELEDAIRAMPFRSVTIARPSLLLGDRRELRLGETLARPFGVLMPPKYRPVHAEQVAAGLVAAALRDEPGVLIIDSRELRKG